jgi:hypothetical protein
LRPDKLEELTSRELDVPRLVARAQIAGELVAEELRGPR